MRTMKMQQELKVCWKISWANHWTLISINVSQTLLISLRH